MPTSYTYTVHTAAKLNVFEGAAGVGVCFLPAERGERGFVHVYSGNTEKPLI